MNQIIVLVHTVLLLVVPYLYGTTINSTGLVLLRGKAPEPTREQCIRSYRGALKRQEDGGLGWLVKGKGATADVLTPRARTRVPPHYRPQYSSHSKSNVTCDGRM
eukprot:COSAG02_NODE_28109_length_596_cov_0.824950_1_plen_104_part_01